MVSVRGQIPPSISRGERGVEETDGKVRETRVPLRLSLRFCVTVLGLVLFAIAFLGTSQAYALPSFTGQTGQPCSACHVGGFGPQLTAFGIYFKATGYTVGGGTGVWSHIPVNYQFEGPTYTQLAKARPTAPAGWNGQTNNCMSPGCSSFVVAGGQFGRGEIWRRRNVKGLCESP